MLFHLPKALAILQIYGVTFHLYRSGRICLSFFSSYCSNAYKTQVKLYLPKSEEEEVPSNLLLQQDIIWRQTALLAPSVTQLLRNHFRLTLILIGPNKILLVLY